MKIKNLLFICISLALLKKFMLNNLQINYPSNNLYGSAEAYSKNNSDKIITPKIEIKNGKNITHGRWNVQK